MTKLNEEKQKICHDFFYVYEICHVWPIGVCIIQRH